MEQRKMSEEKEAKNEWVHFRELRARCPVCKAQRSGDHRASI